ncbi:glycoside hydrolase family 47 protein [Schizothecium vesticola]|uniref:alpha-1,2-Mannosidase n=1 Tax=Schizothecium vesticola TaxID=314040 RepID=A0AA40EPI3_9PEZI|nr:glycoside hydrolase family 47 protein [Schizothecium vesticola]
MRPLFGSGSPLLRTWAAILLTLTLLARISIALPPSTGGGNHGPGHRFGPQRPGNGHNRQQGPYPNNNNNNNNNNTLPRYRPHRARAEAVSRAFQNSWDAYYKYAFPRDSLRPVRGEGYDDRNGWGATAVDALSTALIMGKWEIVDVILGHVQTIDFDKTDDDVSLFETTIRYLGGLISAYDLLTGPLKTQATRYPPSTIQDILTQAVRLADNLKVAFHTPSGIPDNILRFNPPRTTNSTTNGLATIGTLVLEWTRLSDITGNPEYARLAQTAESHLLSPQPPSIGEPFPGLLGSDVNISTGLFVSSSGGWGGGSDSFYEYLVKMHVYSPSRFGAYRDRFLAATDSSLAYLLSHSTARPDLTYLAMWENATTLHFVSEHLACFSGGTFLLAALHSPTPSTSTRLTNLGLDLTTSCLNTYTSTLTHIGPESFRWQDSLLPPSRLNHLPPTNQSAFHRAHGFWTASPGYVLRPEVFESLYYAYRATGDARFQDAAWAAFGAVERACAVVVGGRSRGYSSVRDVDWVGGGGWTDFMESFWMAEVVKYAYLIQAEEAPWQVKVGGGGQFVFNTEAHPIRVAEGG